VAVVAGCVRQEPYEVAETGELRRHSVSYAEELRPLDAPA
jgi:hypothetical protein